MMILDLWFVVVGSCVVVFLGEKDYGRNDKSGRWKCRPKSNPNQSRWRILIRVARWNKSNKSAPKREHGDLQF